MDYRQNTEVITTQRRELSRLTVLLGALFFITFLAAIFVGLDGLLEYFKLVRGSPLTTVETGAVITSASAVALLAMGMSVSAVTDRNKQTANKTK